MGNFPGGAGPGRPKGSKNKTTALLKDAILKAAEEAGGDDGLVGYLTIQAKVNAGPFLALLGKVLPLQIQGDPENPLLSPHDPRETAKAVLAILTGAVGATDTPETGSE
jgi:hypothetical protein